MGHHSGKNGGASPPDDDLLAGQLRPGLYLVATPIGNLGDLSIRALDVLRRCDAVACEDTRVTARLLSAHGIPKKPFLLYNDHADERDRDRILERLRAGERIALVSDAGSPLVSDPGFKLVRACRDEGLTVTAAPGASSVITALQLSGLPSDRFAFIGFLPPKTGARRDLLADWARVPATLVCFETAPRLADSLKDLAAVLGGERVVAITRELTKLFEEVRSGPLAEMAQRIAQDGPPKGEIVLVIAPPQETATVWTDEALRDRLRDALARDSLKDAVARVSAETGEKRRRVYDLALELKS